MIDETSPNGAVGGIIPTRAGGGNDPASASADASWASVFPSIVWGLLKYKGDTTVGQFWPGLTRFMVRSSYHLPRMLQLRTTLHTPGAMFYLVPRLIRC